MLSSKLTELNQARAKLALLEAAVAADIGKELAALPKQFGFSSVNEFITAVKRASDGRSNGVTIPGVAGGTRKRRTRAVITDATRASVKRLVKEGKTGSAIAKELGISLPSVQNIKKALGLVRKR